MKRLKLKIIYIFLTIIMLGATQGYAAGSYYDWRVTRRGSTWSQKNYNLRGVTINCDHSSLVWWPNSSKITPKYYGIFINADLVGATILSDCENAQFAGANLTGATLGTTNEDPDYRTSFKGATFVCTKFGMAKLEKATIRNSDMRAVNFSNQYGYAIMNLKGVQITKSNFSHAKFNGADLSKHTENEEEKKYIYTTIKNSAFSYAEFKGAHLSDAILKAESLDTNNIFFGADFSGAIMERVDFTYANSEFAIFAHAKAKKAIFKSAQLQGADFTGAEIDDVDFTKANIDNAIALDKRDLTGVKFVECKKTTEAIKSYEGNRLNNVTFAGNSKEEMDLRDTNFKGAVVKGGSFEDCDFHGANIFNARFTGTTFKNINFDEFKNMENAVFDNCIYENCRLDGADFGNVEMIGTIKDLDFSKVKNLPHRIFRDDTVINCQFNGMDLSDRQEGTQPFDFSNAVLEDCEFNNCNFEGAIFHNTTLRPGEKNIGVKFNNSDMADTDFTEAMMDTVDFTGVKDLPKNTFTKAAQPLRKVNLMVYNHDLTEFKFNDCAFDDCYFADKSDPDNPVYADLSLADFTDVKFIGDVSYINLTGCLKFPSAALRGAVDTQRKLDHIVFHNHNKSTVGYLELTYCDITNSDFSGEDGNPTDMTKVKFDGSTLADVDFSFCENFESDAFANLADMTLTRVDFTDSDMTGVLFSGLALADSIFKDANLKDTHFANITFNNTDNIVRDMNFTGADVVDKDAFQGLTLINVSFYGYDFNPYPPQDPDNGQFSGCTFIGVDFTNAKLKEAEFSSSHSEGGKDGTARLNFTGADLDKVVFGTDDDPPSLMPLQYIVFNGCKNLLTATGRPFDNRTGTDSIICVSFDQLNYLQAQDFSKSTFKDVSFKQSNLNSTKFINCKSDPGGDLMLDFTQADITNIDFKDVTGQGDIDLENLNFSGCTGIETVQNVRWGGEPPVKMRNVWFNGLTLGNSTQKFNLTHTIFIDCRFDEGDLTDADFEGASIDGTTYASMSFAYCKGFPYHIIQGMTTLNNLDLSGVDFCDEVDFSYKNIQGCEFIDANLSGCGFYDTMIADTDFNSAFCNNVDFTGTTFGENLSFKNAYLNYAKFTFIVQPPAIYNIPDFAHAKLYKADFTIVFEPYILDNLMIWDDGQGKFRSRFHNVCFYNTSFDGSDFRNSKEDLITPVFDGAHFSYTDFSDMNFSGLTMPRASFAGADFRKAKLIGTIFSSYAKEYPAGPYYAAILNQTDLRGTDLTNANFHRMGINRIKHNDKITWDHTIWVDGEKYDSEPPGLD